MQSWHSTRGALDKIDEKSGVGAAGVAAAAAAAAMPGVGDGGRGAVGDVPQRCWQYLRGTYRALSGRTRDKTVARGGLASRGEARHMLGRISNR